MANFLKRYKLTIGNNQEVVDKMVPVQTDIPNLIPTTGPVNAPKIGWWLQTLVDAHFVTAPEPIINQTSVNVLTVPAGTKARRFTEIQMEAEISYKTSQSSSTDQDSTLKLYNISDENQAFIKANYFVFLEAGYQTDKDIPLIFSGQILKVTTEKQGPDMVTTLLCKDNSLPTGNVLMCISYNKGMSYIEIIRDMLARLANVGVPTGHFITTGPLANDPIIRKCQSGYVTEGKLVQDLITLCASINYRAYFSLGKIYVEPAFTESRVYIVELAASQIKSARPEDDSSNQTLKSKDPTGLMIKTFLDGRITSDKYLKVKDGKWKGEYKITEVKHILNYEGESWDTEITCIKKV